jgi:hypothetical protein
VLAHPTQPWDVTLDDSYVYWTEYTGNGAVRRVLKSGGSPKDVATGEYLPNDVVVAGGYAYWGDGVGSGQLMEAPVTGGTPTKLAGGTQSGVSMVVSDGTYVYYVGNYNLVYSIPLGGGSQGIASSGPYNSNIQDIVYQGNALYWTNNGVWDSQYTYKIPGTATVSKLALVQGANRETIVPNLDYPLNQVAADPKYVFYNDGTYIYRTTVDGGAVTKVVTLVTTALNSSPVTDMVSDGSHLYFSDGAIIYKLPVGGGAPVSIAWGYKNIHALAVDDGDVYFTDLSGGLVAKVPK